MYIKNILVGLFDPKNALHEKKWSNSTQQKKPQRDDSYILDPQENEEENVIIKESDILQEFDFQSFGVMELLNKDAEIFEDQSQQNFEYNNSTVQFIFCFLK